MKISLFGLGLSFCMIANGCLSIQVEMYPTTSIILYNISVVNYILTFFEKEGLTCIPYQFLWIRTGCQS